MGSTGQMPRIQLTWGDFVGVYGCRPWEGLGSFGLASLIVEGQLGEGE